MLHVFLVSFNVYVIHNMPIESRFYDITLILLIYAELTFPMSRDRYY